MVAGDPTKPGYKSSELMSSVMGTILAAGYGLTDESEWVRMSGVFVIGLVVTAFIYSRTKIKGAQVECAHKTKEKE